MGGERGNMEEVGLGGREDNGGERWVRGWDGQLRVPISPFKKISLVIDLGSLWALLVVPALHGHPAASQEHHTQSPKPPPACP